VPSSVNGAGGSISRLGAVARALRPVASVFAGLGFFVGAWAVVTADVERALGFGASGFGLVLAVALAGSAMVNALAGGWAERWGTRRVLAWGLAAWGLTLLGVSVSGSGLWLAAAIVVAISLGGAVDVTMNVAAVAGLADRPGQLVRFHAWFNGGAVAGAAGAGLLLHAGLSWRWALAATVPLAVANVAWVQRTDLPAGLAAESRGGHGLFGAIQTVRAEGLALLAFVFACGAMVEGGIDTWGVLVLRQRLDVGVLVGAAAYLMGAAVATVARITLGPAAGALGAQRGVGLGAGLATLGLVLLAVAPTAGAVVGLVLAAAGISVCWPLLISHASAGFERPGLVVGGVTAIGYLGFVVGPPLVGWLARGLGLRHALLVLAASAAFVAVAPSRFGPAARVAVPAVTQDAAGGAHRAAGTGDGVSESGGVSESDGVSESGGARSG